METFFAIQSRSSIKKFSDAIVARELLEKCLESATWAPNHRMTEPWQFRVLAGESRIRLSEAIAEQMSGASGYVHESSLEERRELIRERVTYPRRMFGDVRQSMEIEKIRKKLLSAPVIVCVYSDQGKDAVVSRENFSATAAAVQNFLLCAHDLGLGAIWRTAEYFEGSHVKSFLNVGEEASFVAAIYLGYSEQRQVPRRRTSWEKKTLWV